MAKWEAIDADGNSYSGDGREALLALVNARKLTAADGLYDNTTKAWITVGKYLGPRAEGVKPGSAPPPPLDQRQLILFAALGAAVLLTVLVFTFADELFPPDQPPALMANTRPDASAPVAGTRGDNPGGENRGDNRSGERAAAVATGEKYNVLIESVGSRGDGLTHVKGMVVFVPGAREGEKLQVRITGVSRTTAQAEKIGPATGPVEVAAPRASDGGTAPAATGGDSSRPSAVTVGQVYDVKIDALGGRGDGIAHIEGMVIFVPGTQTGQQLKIRVTEVGPRFARAEVVR